MLNPVSPSDSQSRVNSGVGSFTTGLSGGGVNSTQLLHLEHVRLVCGKPAEGTPQQPHSLVISLQGFYKTVRRYEW